MKQRNIIIHFIAIATILFTCSRSAASRGDLEHNTFVQGNTTRMNAIADREGFIVIYPAGIAGQWNDGRGKTFKRGKDNTDIDDVGFISALIDLFVKNKVADSKRIYVMGLSNGGMMASPKKCCFTA